MKQRAQRPLAIPHILFSFFKELKITTVDDLRNNLAKLRSMPGFGDLRDRKAHNFLKKWNATTESRNTTFTYRVFDSDNAFPIFHEFRAQFQNIRSPLVVEIPKQLRRKFELFEIDSPEELIRKHGTLYDHIGVNTVGVLNKYLLANMAVAQAIAGPDLPMENFSAELSQAIDHFFGCWDAKYRYIYHKRLLGHYYSRKEVVRVFGISPRATIHNSDVQHVFGIARNFLLGVRERGITPPPKQLSKVLATVYEQVTRAQFLACDNLWRTFQTFQATRFTSGQWTSIKATMKMLGFTFFTATTSKGREEFILSHSLHRRSFIRSVQATLQVLRTNITPTKLRPLVREVNARLEMDLDLPLLVKFLGSSKLVHFVDGQAAIKCRYLKTQADQAVLVLHQAQTPLLAEEIFEAINLQIAREGGAPLGSRRPQNFAYHDRLVLGDDERWTLGPPPRPGEAASV